MLDMGSVQQKAQTAMTCFSKNKDYLLRQHPEFEEDINIIGLRGQELLKQLKEPDLLTRINQKTVDDVAQQKPHEEIVKSILANYGL
jgi:hypothetical protein